MVVICAAMRNLDSLRNRGAREEQGVGRLMPAARPSEAVIRNAIKAALACGLNVGAVEVTPGGGVRILASDGDHEIPSRDSSEGNTCDGLFGEASD